MSFFAASLSSSFHRTFASNSSFSAFARWWSRSVCGCCLNSGLVFPLSSPFITIFKFSLDWSILRLSCDAVNANRSRCCLSYLVQLPHSSARFTMSLCVCGHHRYCETPSMVSCPGCPRWILLSTAWRNCTGFSSLLSTRMQSSCTAICNHKGLVYGPISSKPCLLSRSITRLSRSIQVSSDVNSAKRLLSKSFEILSNVSSVDCLCSFCSFRLCIYLLGDSIVRIFLPSSVSSVVVMCNSITCTSLTFLSTCCAGNVLIGTGMLSSFTASSSRVLLDDVLDSPPSIAKMIGACCPPLFVGPLTVSTLLGTGALFHYLSCLYSSGSLELSFFFVVVFPWLPLLIVHSCCSFNSSTSDLECSLPCPRFSVPVVYPITSRVIGSNFFLKSTFVSLFLYFFVSLNFGLF